MKNILKLSLLLFLSIFAACNSDDGVVSTAQPSSGDVLKLVVSATDFVTDGAPDTRATDSEKKIVFENDDRVGVIILDGSSNILANNVPYKYSNGAWSFDSSNNEGKDQCYYYNKATTYIVYYPYNQAANSIKTVDDLKEKFKPQADQSTKEAYRASDLMVWSHTSGTPSKSLNVTLTHAYASVSFFSKATYLLDDGKNTPANISDVNIMIDKNIYIPYQAADGSFRYILPDGFKGKVRCFYTVAGKESYSNTIDVSSGVTANMRYTFGTKITSTYTLADAKVGDFYCKRNDNGNGYLIPGDAALTADQQTACVGVVFWVGDATKKDKTLKSDHSDCTHGLVVALNDASNGTAWQTSVRVVRIQGWLNNYRPNQYLPVWGDLDNNSVSLNNIQGYNNTEAIEEYNANNDENLVLAVSTVVAYRSIVSAPANSSDWYLPSEKELTLLCGKDVNDIWKNKNIGTANRDLINGKLRSISSVAAEISWFIYWSSTESPAGMYAFFKSFSGEYMDATTKKAAYKVRCVLAF